MARTKKQPPIKVISYVERQNGERVRVDDLTPEEKRRVADQLATTALSTYLTECLRDKYPNVAKFEVTYEQMPEGAPQGPRINIMV